VIELRFHGRGGQGAVLAAELLARAAFLDGKFPQSFPFFGVERRGAPVTAFARIDERPIPLRTSVETPDVVVVLEHNLRSTVGVTRGLPPEGLLLVNGSYLADATEGPGPRHRAVVDATRIALRHGLGTAMLPIVNTPMLGALARVSGVVTIEALEQAIERYAPARPAANRDAARDGFHEVQLREVEPVPLPAAASLVLEIPEAPSADRPSSTLTTASWRTLRPRIVLDRCTRCNFCWKFCPDDAIAFDPDGYPVLRPEYCKGCGICAAECPPKTIEMVAES
jgi:pyruvate ferredoxin oxidoreductase gamma subunit